MLELRNIKKDYYIDGKPFAALKGLSLSFPDKGFVAVLGPSGCGKTTLLNIIGGLDHYTSGDLLIDGKSTHNFKDSEWDAFRNEMVGFVFQTYNLIPHESVLANVETSLILNGVLGSSRRDRALKALDSVGLGDSAKKKPNQLSGGQMQRVALARAIVNNPKIVLADEPTGSLDSVTSTQVMEILKDISKDRLVIMVTHNRDLASRYAGRIIEMKDGSITSDSVPLALGETIASGKVISKKTSMSFWTAIKSSLSSIKTKKARTILTIVASSFGIIGVSLVLAISNGFTNYVDDVESSLASSMPISITPAQYSYNSNAIATDNDPEYPDDGNLIVYDDSSSSYISHRNNYNQDYFNYIDKTKTNGLAREILYNREDLAFNVLTQDGDRTTSDGSPLAATVDQYAESSVTNDVVSTLTGLPATVFHELYGDESGLSSMYDCIYGRYPTSYDEIVLVTDRYNRIDFTTLQDLGIVSSEALSSTTAGAKISFKNLVYDSAGDTAYKPYYAYLNSDWFDMYDASGNPIAPEAQTIPTWKIDHFNDFTNQFVGTASTQDIQYYRLQSDTSSIMNDATGRYHPIQLKIVGVLRPSESSYVNLMPASIGYTTALKNKIAADVAEGGKGAALGKIQSSNFYIYRNGGSGDGTPDGLEALNSAIQKVFSTGASAVSESTLNDLITSAYRWNTVYKYRNSGYPYSSTSTYWFLRDNMAVGGDFNENNITDLPATPTTAYSATDATWQAFINYWEEKLTSADFYNNVVNDGNSWGAIDFLAYYNSYALVSSILIFPTNLRVKDQLHAYLDAYNVGKSDSETILYTDLMSSFTGSLGILLNVISIILLVFASISLVVSSVMTGIITYVSVIERTKEIGILRACGARKIDVARLFEAECSVVGLGAGIIGIGFTYLACIPINIVLNNLYPGNNLSSIAQLNPLHAALLLALAVVLALVSGAIPAFIASKRDPVEALRTE
jgi:putative ABC transport system permease protein